MDVTAANGLSDPNGLTSTAVEEHPKSRRDEQAIARSRH